MIPNDFLARAIIRPRPFRFARLFEVLGDALGLAVIFGLLWAGLVLTGRM